MNLQENAAASLLLIGIGNAPGHTDSATQAAIEHCHKLTLRCIEIFGGHSLSGESAQIIARFNSANTACRAALVIRDKTAALLADDRGRVVPGIPILCLKGRAYLDPAGSLLMEKLTPVINALIANESSGRMRIDADTLKALSPDLQRHFQPDADTPTHHLASGRFYRYQAPHDPAPSAAATAASETAGLPELPELTERALPEGEVSDPFAIPISAALAAPDTHALPPAIPAPSAPSAESTPSAASARITLTTPDGARIVLGEQQTFTIGRNRNCHLCLAGASISRLHAWIRADDTGRFTLLDQSTNGTFVKIGNAPEVHLRHQEIDLHDTGVIGIAGSTQDDHAPQIRFEISAAK